jgi:hypothetical protein
MTNLIVSDLRTLTASGSGGGLGPPFELWWDLGDEAYPDRGWIDSAAVVLGWWLAGLHQLQTGTDPVSFSFMEGPFAFEVTRQGDLAVLRFEPQPEVVIPMKELTQQVARAARIVQRVLREQKADTRLIDALAKGLGDLTSRTVSGPPT